MGAVAYILQLKHIENHRVLTASRAPILPANRRGECVGATGDLRAAHHRSLHELTLPGVTIILQRAVTSARGILGFHGHGLARVFWAQAAGVHAPAPYEHHRSCEGGNV